MANQNLQNGVEEKRKSDISKIYRGLQLELRSVPSKHDDSKCLLRFHNCTPYSITLFWVDFKGIPIKYPLLRRGASINVDTYVSHLWFFKAKDENADHHQQSKAIRVLAIPEESIDLSSNASLLRLFPDQTLNSTAGSTATTSTTVATSTTGERHTFQDAILGLNNVIICSLCKHILKQYSQAPTKFPCPHFTGEARLSVSDLHGGSPLTNYGSTYIYSCTEHSHRRTHSLQRRNIYLVEPFFNLRERCFLALQDRIKHTDIVDFNLPISLQMEFLKFITVPRKLIE